MMALMCHASNGMLAKVSSFFSSVTGCAHSSWMAAFWRMALA